MSATLGNARCRIEVPIQWRVSCRVSPHYCCRCLAINTTWIPPDINNVCSYMIYTQCTCVYSKTCQTKVTDT